MIKILNAYELGVDVVGKKIDTLRKRSHVPIVVICERGHMPYMLDIGADDCIDCMCDEVEAKARYTALERRDKKMKFKNTRVNSGRIVLDVKCGDVNVADKSVHLAPAEYRALFYLMLNAGELVMRDSISMRTFKDSVWRSAHLINMHIYNLRKKLGKRVKIVTIPRRGFMLEV
jgi:DNA-binding response OmpR family regulator